LRKKKCAVCKNYFVPDRPFQKACSIPCAVEHGRVLNEKKQRKKASEEKRADKEKLARLTPRYLEGKAQDAINAYVRVRDYERGCISCGKDMHWNGQWHAGHLKTRGANSFLRYHLWNLNKQCSVCNNHHSGNVAEHERGIVVRYGQERLDFLQSAPKMRRYSDEYLIRLADVFRKKTRILKKRKGIA
jgi:hypothetical protein